MEIPESLKPHPELVLLARRSAAIAATLGLSEEQHLYLAHGIYATYVARAKIAVPPPPPAPESPTERLLFNTGSYIGLLLATLKE